MKTFKELFIERWRKNPAYRKEDEEEFEDALNAKLFKEMEIAAEEYKGQFACSCNKEVPAEPSPQLDLFHHSV